MDSIDKALQPLQLQDKPNISATAREYGLDRSTLSKRFTGGAQSHQTKCQNQGLLSPAQEKTLVQYINKLTDRGIPPTPAMILNFVHNIVGKRPGKSWSYRFCKRWTSVLDSRYLTTLDAARYKADSRRSYELYFELVQSKIQQYEIKAHNMYNMDEKGFLIGFISKAKRVFTKTTFESKRLIGAL